MADEILIINRIALSDLTGLKGKEPGHYLFTRKIYGTEVAVF